MMRKAQETSRQSPPTFAEAGNARQKARAAGLDPDRWYAVEYESAVKKGQVKEVIFWNCSIALFRGEDGGLAAVQNHCPHRQLKLTHGVVDRCHLRCAYHGWTFNRDGWLVDYSHDSFGKPLIKNQLRTYPVQARYGLIWLFPGDPAVARERKIPEILELTGDHPWANFTVDFTWRTHHSMVIDNICDFAHAFLHRKYRPFIDAKLTHYEADEDRVYLTYDAYMAAGRISGIFVDRNRVNTRSIELCYQYPYQWTNTGDSIKNWSFLLPIDERTTRVFFSVLFRQCEDSADFYKNAEVADPNRAEHRQTLGVQAYPSGGRDGPGSGATGLRTALECAAHRAQPRRAAVPAVDGAEMGRLSRPSGGIGPRCKAAKRVIER